MSTPGMDEAPTGSVPLVSARHQPMTNQQALILAVVTAILGAVGGAGGGMTFLFVDFRIRLTDVSAAERSLIVRELY